MLRQGYVKETVADYNAAQQLPPLNTLPQWSRVNTLDKARYPKPFLKDRLQPLPDPQSSNESLVDVSINNNTGEMEVVDDYGNVAHAALRIKHLERSIAFLQQQHQEVLHNLHEEIDHLKKHNQDMQFQLVLLHQMSRNNSDVSKQDSVKAEGKTNTSSSTKGSNPPVPIMNTVSKENKMTDLKVVFIEQELKDLQAELKEERQKNKYLTDLLELAESKLSPKDVDVSLSITSEKGSRKKVMMEDRMSEPASGQVAPPHTAALTDTLPYNATIDTNVIVHPKSAPPREPTNDEYEEIVKHLAKMNDRQTHELNQLKSDLKDVLYSHKWSPDAYLLAKAYVVADENKESAEKDQLPKLETKQKTKRLPEVAYIQRQQVSLPAMSHTLGNKAVERRKRTQILQKSRFMRDLVP